MSEIRELIDQAKDGEITYEEPEDNFGEGIQFAESENDDSEGELEVSSSEEKQVSSDEKEASVGEQEGEAEELEPINPPVSWPAEDKERFLELPHEIQQRIAERETQRERAFHSNRQRYAAYDKATEQYKDFITNMYGEESKAIETALAWLKQANENPIDTVREILNVRGIDPRLLVASAENMGPQDPHSRQMALELQQLKARELQREEQERQRLQQEQEAHLQQLDKEVETFSNERDGDGKLKHPYIGELMEDMSVFIPHLMQQMPSSSNKDILTEAYSRAMRANPTTFAKYEQQLEQRKAEELEERAKKAGVASKSVSGSLGGSSSSVSKDMDIRSIIDLARQGQL